MDNSDILTSTSTLRVPNAQREHDGSNVVAGSQASGISQSSSPRSSYLPSPTDSPPDSISSLPSIGSSFFFSSAAASPPHSHPHSDHARDSTQGLIIPSLTLPTALPQPTQYGKTLGGIRLFITGEGADDHDLVSSLLLDDNEDVVDPGIWEETNEGSVLRVSTDWVEHRDPHGLEKFEPSRNVEIVTRKVSNASAVLPIIHSPFYALLEIIDPHCQPSATLISLIASPHVPIYTAFVILSKSAPSAEEDNLIDALATHVPVIVFRYGLDRTRFPSRPHMSSFCPSSASALRNGLFRSPETLLSLRYEAAERFLHWREVERAVESIHTSNREIAHRFLASAPSWDKAKWQAEWESRLSHDVATRSREDTVTSRPVNMVHRPVPSMVDPLHFSSLIAFSFSLLNPAKARVMNSVSTFMQLVSDCQVRIAMVGSFCIGVGVGWMLR
ncbi:hypothetical protein BKA82DRAFT_4170674 [Pisolithus tinctorius]|nr:hypothetical protein BKA82DRAFT_4170674 [Pisolithus tinctorius]